MIAIPIDQRLEAIVGAASGLKAINLAMDTSATVTLNATGKSILCAAAWKCSGNLSSQYFRLGGFSGSGSYLAYLESTSSSSDQIRVRFQNEAGAQQNSLILTTGRAAGIHSAVWYLNATQTQAYLWVDSTANYVTRAVDVGAANQLVLTNAYISSTGQAPSIPSRNEFERVSGYAFVGLAQPSNTKITQMLSWMKRTVA